MKSITLREMAIVVGDRCAATACHCVDRGEAVLGRGFPPYHLECDCRIRWKRPGVQCPDCLADAFPCPQCGRAVPVYIAPDGVHVGHCETCSTPFGVVDAECPHATCR